MQEAAVKQKVFFTNQIVKAPYGSFQILGFRTLLGEKYAQLKEVTPHGRLLRGELALPLSILEPKPFMYCGQVYETLEEIKEAAEYLEKDAKFLAGQAEIYSAKSGLYYKDLAEKVKNNSHHSLELATYLNSIQSAVFP